jgi:hypothetical protein
MRPFNPRMFPDEVAFVRNSWSTGDVPGLVPVEEATGTLPCNVQSPDDTADPSFPASDSMGTHQAYRVSFPADPQLRQGDTLGWNGSVLTVLAPARKVARGRLWRLACSHTT